MATAMGARDLFRMVRHGLDVRSIHAHVRRPFRFLVCGDPALVAELRVLLLSGPSDALVPADAAACLETIYPHTYVADATGEVRAAVFLGRRGDTPNLEPLRALKVPIFAITVDPEAVPSSPASLPARGTVGEYTVPALTRDALRNRVFPHLVDAARGIEIAVGRNFPPLRETVAAKLTRDAAHNALKVAVASAVVDHVPVLGVVLGAVASAGDMVAITGIQTMLMLHIEATYGRDPDIHRVWQLLPVVGAGFGWRALARELFGFLPVAGIAIKGAIAYAGTIVVGEGVTFFFEHGKHMSKSQASQIYERTKEDTLRFARDFVGKLRNKE